MFNTSGDILNWVLAISVAALSFFLCWAIYYFIASIQGIYRLIKKVESGISKAEEILDIAKNKLKNSSAYFTILAEVAKRAMEMVGRRRDKRAADREQNQESVKSTKSSKSGRSR
jgi:biopolymer transport protein ExbB/TolQ